MNFLKIIIEKLSSQTSRDISFELLKESLEKGFDHFVFESDAMKRIDEEITRVAQIDEFTILLTGETGVGKDLVAIEIHGRSKRRDKNFVIISLAEIRDSVIKSEIFGYEREAFTGAERRKLGRFELANGGTLYLAEISEIPHEVQVELFSFFQYRAITRVGGTEQIKLNLNLIMATNQDIEKLNKEGKLRDDFYHRINVFRIHIPPLRERKEDIPILVNYFLNKFSLKYYGFRRVLKVSDDVLDLFLNYSWPGNVRELSNVIESAVLKAPFDSDELTVNCYGWV